VPRLHTKILLSLSLVAAIYVGVSSQIQKATLLPSFAALEHSSAHADLSRAVEGIVKENAHVDNFVSDWSGWDDTYQYMEDKNEAYFKSNLANDVFRRDSFDCLAFVRLDGTEVWRGAMAAGETIDIPELPQPWSLTHPLLAPRGPQDCVKGILLTARGPLLLASRIVTNSARDAPSRGWIVMGRFLDQGRMEDLASQAHLDLSILPAPTVKESQDRAAMARLRAGGWDGIDAQDDDLLTASALLDALDGSPGLFVRVTIPRTVLAQGQTALGYADLTMLVAVLVLFTSVFFMLRGMVVRPIANLTNHALKIRHTDDLTLRCSSERSDEIGQLAREFDHMVGQLASSRANHVEKAREGGMSEVAVEVLHDVGNTMQGLRTSWGTLLESLDGRAFTDLLRLIALMQPHKDDLGRWLAEDEKGRKVPSFLMTLAGGLERERTAMREQVQTMADALQHVEALLDRQRQHAGRAGVCEQLSVAALLAEARRVAAVDPAIEVVVTGAVDAVLEVERSRLVAVVVNLLRNAQDAVVMGGDKGRIRLHVEVNANGLRLTVEDDGVGIPRADLTRVFSRGYTTKAKGNGIGLHSCAITLGEFGGRIVAESEGAGRGARFVVELPESMLLPQEVTR
jgi:signal transduction histidine kinase